MNIDDLINDIEELEKEGEDPRLIEALKGLIHITYESSINQISEKNFEKDCKNFRTLFPDYPFPNCIYFKGETNE